MQVEAEFFSRFFALSLIEESYVIEAIAQYFKKSDGIFRDGHNKEIGAPQILRAIKCYKQQREKNKFDKSLKWNYHFLKWENLELSISEWIKFRNSTSEENFIAVLLGLVLKVNENVILEALQITSGSLRYRYGDGLNDLIKAKDLSNGQA